MRVEDLNNIFALSELLISKDIVSKDGSFVDMDYFFASLDDLGPRESLDLADTLGKFVKASAKLKKMKLSTINIKT